MLLVIATDRLAFMKMSPFYYFLIGLPTFPLFLPLCQKKNFSSLPFNNSSLPLPQTIPSILMNHARYFLYIYFLKQEYCFNLRGLLGWKIKKLLNVRFFGIIISWDEVNLYGENFWALGQLGPPKNGGSIFSPIISNI